MTPPSSRVGETEWCGRCEWVAGATRRFRKMCQFGILKQGILLKVVNDWTAEELTVKRKLWYTSECEWVIPGS